MNNSNLVTLKTAKLFDVTALAKHLLEHQFLLVNDSKSALCSFGTSPALFSLYRTDDIETAFQDNLLPSDPGYVFQFIEIQNVEIDELMEYLIHSDIIDDPEILRSWHEHKAWHDMLSDCLYSAMTSDFVYPDCYSDRLYVYSDISTIQRFAELLVDVTSVSFYPESLESQYSIINEMLPFVVDELIPMTSYNDDKEVSVEQITASVTKLSLYLAKLFWIASL